MARMNSKYPGTCRDCRERFPAGTLIDYTRNAPRGRKTAHADCANPGPVVTDAALATVTVEEGAPGHGPGCYGECDGLYDCTATAGGDYYGTAQEAARGVSFEVRTSGGTFYRNRQGRCIDAPCCGCCTI